MREFGAQVRERLPALQKHFEHASVRTGIDWRLLAALAYQESRWDERAVSAQGARGILMLMPEVLSASGVRDPFDPRQNILAGARHLFALKQRLPGRIGEPDRTWLAIAAYNAGPGALEDARIVTQMRGGNPDSWSDVYDNLPLLAEEEWYTRVRNGYSRGWETQVTIDRVREFADVLAWRTTRPDAAPIAATGP
jgi:membrane-bound lytic murein transglycosylase F